LATPAAFIYVCAAPALGRPGTRTDRSSGRETRSNRKNANPEACGESTIEKQTRPEKNGARRKADILSDRVTLQISPEMRDEVDLMARQLQRSKITKAERIAANLVVRVAIRYFLDEFSPRRGEDVNSKDELLAAAKRQDRDE
jgi:hypothetical protein